jgi:phasin family protein
MNVTLNKLLAPVKELNDLTVKNIEQIVEIQIKTIQENAKASLDAFQATADIKDLESLQTYLKVQAGAAETLSKFAVEDAKEVASLGNAYVANVKGVVEKALAA